jgi:hypothetical protein
MSFFYPWFINLPEAQTYYLSNSYTLSIGIKLAILLFDSCFGGFPLIAETISQVPLQLWII